MRGMIRSLARYEQAKLLNSGGWNGKLPRMITPSDIDFGVLVDHTFDNSGHILFVEFCRDGKLWKDLERGQRLLYQNLVKNCPEKHVAALCSHSVPVDRHINTCTDIDSFQLLFCKKIKRKIRPKPVMYHCISSSKPGVDWEEFVIAWCQNGVGALRELRKSSYKIL